MESRKKKTTASRGKPAKKKSARTTAKSRKAVEEDSPKSFRGSSLLNQVIRMSGIPASQIHKDLKTILERKNLDENHLTLDQLRVVVASYLREIMGGLLEKRPDPDPKSTRH